MCRTISIVELCTNTMQKANAGEETHSQFENCIKSGENHLTDVRIASKRLRNCKATPQEESCYVAISDK